MPKQHFTAFQVTVDFVPSSTVRDAEVSGPPIILAGCQAELDADHANNLNCDDGRDERVTKSPQCVIVDHPVGSLKDRGFVAAVRKRKDGWSLLSML